MRCPIPRPVTRFTFLFPLLLATLTPTQAQTHSPADRTPQAELSGLIQGVFERAVAYCNEAVPENAGRLNDALLASRVAIDAAAEQIVDELGPEAQDVFDPRARSQWQRAADDLLSTIRASDPRRYCTTWPDRLVTISPQAMVSEFKSGYRATKAMAMARPERKGHGAPPDDAVHRFVKISQVGESTVLAYAATAGNDTTAARGKCEAKVILSSRDIFAEWAAIATRLLFEGDSGGQEIQRISALLESPDGQDFLAAKAKIQHDVMHGVPMAQASASMRTRLQHLPPEMSPPIRRVAEVGKLLEDPRQFKQWPRYGEFMARLGVCVSRR
jgi:hypothetical protein